MAPKKVSKRRLEPARPAASRTPGIEESNLLVSPTAGALTTIAPPGQQLPVSQACSLEDSRNRGIQGEVGGRGGSL